MDNQVNQQTVIKNIEVLLDRIKTKHDLFMDPDRVVEINKLISALNDARTIVSRTTENLAVPWANTKIVVAGELFDDFYKHGSFRHLYKAIDFATFRDNWQSFATSQLDSATLLRMARHDLAIEAADRAKYEAENSTTNQVSAALSAMAALQNRINEQMGLLDAADRNRQAAIDALISSKEHQLNVALANFENGQGARQQQLDSMIADLGKLGEAVSTNVLSSNQNIAAEQESRGAMFWGSIALAAFAAWIYYVLFHGPNNVAPTIEAITSLAAEGRAPEATWQAAAARILTTLPLVVLIGFATVKGNRCNRAARYYRLVQLEFYALNPFLTSLHVESQAAIKTILAPKMFGDRTVFSAESDQRSDVIGQTTSLFENIRDVFKK